MKELQKIISVSIIIPLFFHSISIAQIDSTRAGARKVTDYLLPLCFHGNAQDGNPLSLYIRHEKHDMQKFDFARTLRSINPTTQWWFWTSIGVAVVAVAVFLIWFNAEQKIRVERSK